MTVERLRQRVRALSDLLVAAQRPIRILDAIKWDDRVRAQFFADGCRRQPHVDRGYYEARPLGYEPAKLRATLAALRRDIERRLGVSEPAGRILARMCDEYRDVVSMLEYRGLPQFAEFAARLYGRSSDALHPGEPSVKDLGELLDEALSNIAETAFLEEDRRDIPSERAVEILQARLDAVFHAPDARVRVTVSDGIIADAAAGSDYIKLRRDAMFSERDIGVLEAHEGWVHVGTTINGRSQPVCTFLSTGTPSTTITQEGLAVLVEVLSLRSHPARLRRVTDRIRAIAMAEQGATFLDIFRRLCDEGRAPDEAYATCVRVFRGSTPEFGPFTKDLSYSKGFVLIYNFMRLAVRRGRLERIPLLFCGKLDIEDIPVIHELTEMGLCSAPKYLPPWASDLRFLMVHLAYASFLDGLDLSQIHLHYDALLAAVPTQHS